VSDPAERAWALVSFLLAAPGSEPGWRRFLAALVEAFSGDACALLTRRPQRDRPGTLLAHGIDVGRADALEFGEPGPEPQPMDRLPIGDVFEIPAGSDLLAARQFFRDHLGPQGVLPGPGLGIPLERNERRYGTSFLIVLAKCPGWRPTAADRALLERIGPPLAQARDIDARLARRAHDSEALVAVFDHLALGVILHDETGRVSYANRSAAELLDVPPGLADPDTLAKRTDTGTGALRRFLSTQHVTSRGALAFSHPKDGRPLQIFATALRWPAQAPEARARFARAIFIGDPSRTSGEPAEILRELYGLTQAQARLALLLATDHSIAEAAEQLGIEVSTARTHLNAVFAKTGTNRQTSLVRLLVGGPGQVRRSGQG